MFEVEYIKVKGIRLKTIKDFERIEASMLEFQEDSKSEW